MIYRYLNSEKSLQLRKQEIGSSCYVVRFIRYSFPILRHITLFSGVSIFLLYYGNFHENLSLKDYNLAPKKNIHELIALISCNRKMNFINVTMNIEYRKYF